MARSKLTKAEIQERRERYSVDRISELGALPMATRRRIVCAIVGHSRVVETYFGRVTCGRCNETIGDTLGSVFDMTHYVIRNHACQTCRTNLRKLMWRDKYLTPTPFLKRKKSSGAPE